MKLAGKIFLDTIEQVAQRANVRVTERWGDNEVSFRPVPGGARVTVKHDGTVTIAGANANEVGAIIRALREGR